MAKKHTPDGMRLTDCCGAYSTYQDDTLVCKACFKRVPPGQGDGAEYNISSNYPQPIAPGPHLSGGGR